VSEANGNGLRGDGATGEVYARSGIGHRSGFGRRPAVVVVDLQNGFTDPACPVGGALDEVVAATAQLLDTARELELPVAFTAVGFTPEERRTSAWLRKMPGLAVLEEGSHWCGIDPRVAPQPGEPVWVKRASSAYFGTPLLPFLTGRGVDTVVVAGCVTSGCIRATVIDGISWGHRMILPEECVGDRAAVPHETNLFDIDAKYADVLTLTEVSAALRTLASEEPPVVVA
jgi:nicotinamidase-related amidase